VVMGAGLFELKLGAEFEARFCVCGGCGGGGCRDDELLLLLLT
jgi:hypothetical protein